MNHKATVVFDLDDTLYKEVDFLVSAFHAIDQEIRIRFGISTAFDCMYEAYQQHNDSFQSLIDKYQLPISKEWCLQIYRTHYPAISLAPEVSDALRELVSEGYGIGILSDGRSLTQRNKLSALNLASIIPNEAIVISEEFGSCKPNVKNYSYFMDLYPSSSYIYVGDNLLKDFITPNSLGWESILLLDDGRNIYSQGVMVAQTYKAGHAVRSLSEIPKLLTHILNHE